MAQAKLLGQRRQYVLHYDTFSICSSMVRFTYQFRGPPASPISGIDIHENFVDIRRGEQLEEKFLLEVNPKGQVPALTSTELPAPITDSLDITYYLCEHYPQLSPEPHKELIWKLLKDLHAIQYLSLSLKPGHNRAGDITAAIQERRSRPEISVAYCRALDFKMSYHEANLVHALEADKIQLAETQAEKFFAEVCKQRKLHNTVGGPWIFGNSPTALDAQMVVFIARLLDVNRHDLIPADVLDCAERARNMPEWYSVMKGRHTLPFLMGNSSHPQSKEDHPVTT